MEKLNYSDVKNLDEKTLKAKIGELQKEYTNLKLQQKTSGVEKPHLFKQIKRDVAKLTTALKTKA